MTHVRENFADPFRGDPPDPPTGPLSNSPSTHTAATSTREPRFEMDGWTPPDDVQHTGIGAPQASWLELMDQDIAVVAVPHHAGTGRPAVTVCIGASHRPLELDRAREFVAALVSAIAWAEDPPPPELSERAAAAIADLVVDAQARGPSPVAALAGLEPVGGLVTTISALPSLNERENTQ